MGNKLVLLFTIIELAALLSNAGGGLIGELSMESGCSIDGITLYRFEEDAELENEERRSEGGVVSDEDDGAEVDSLCENRGRLELVTCWL